MTKTIAIFASLLFTVLLYALPVLITCAFILHWNRYVTMLLCGCGFIQFVVVTAMAYARAESEFDE